MTHPVTREEVQRQDIEYKRRTGQSVEGVDDVLRYPVVKGDEAKKKKTEDEMTSKSNGLNLNERISNMKKFNVMRNDVIKKSNLKSNYVSLDSKLKSLKRTVF